MKIKNIIFSLFAVLIICLSSVNSFAEASDYSPVMLVVDDNSPANDVLTMTDISTKLKYNYNIDIGTVKLNSEIGVDDLNKKLTVFVYENRGIIIVDDNAPASDVMLATKIQGWLKDLRVTAIQILVSEVESDDLKESLPAFQCTDSDGGKDYYNKGTATGYEGNQLVTSTDGCRYDDKTLAEVYCDGENLYVEQHVCEYGCKGGACLRKPVEEIRCDVRDILSQDEVKIYTVGRREYEIEASWVDVEAKFKVNGEVTDVLAEGYIYRLVDGSRIQVLHVLHPTGEIANRVEFCFEGAVAPTIEPSEPIVRRDETEPITLPADLRYYPKFLIKDGELNAFIVVGDTAPANDVISAVDIATGLRGYAEVHVTLLVSEIGKRVSESNNFIVVGNEANKKLGLDDDLEPLNEGEGLIQIFRDRDYVVLSVTGYSDLETRSAAKVLAKWQHFELKGDRVKVLVGRMGSLVLSYPPYETVEEPSEVIETVEEPVVKPEVPIPTCYDGIWNDGETGVDCGGPCKPCVATTETCNTGCLGDSTCLPFGTRLVDNEGTPVFCDLNQEFNPQKQERQACQNNYECLSNSCHNGKCIDLEKEIMETRGILENILEWLKRFFS